ERLRVGVQRLSIVALFLVENADVVQRVGDVALVPQLFLECKTLKVVAEGLRIITEIAIDGSEVVRRRSDPRLVLPPNADVQCLSIEANRVRDPASLVVDETEVVQVGGTAHVVVTRDVDGERSLEIALRIVEITKTPMNHAENRHRPRHLSIVANGP